MGKLEVDDESTQAWDDIVNRLAEWQECPWAAPVQPLPPERSG